MIEIISLAIGAAVPAVGAIVWLVRLEGKINVLSSKQESTERRIDGLEERIYSQLDRIESILRAKADK